MSSLPSQFVQKCFWSIFNVISLHLNLLSRLCDVFHGKQSWRRKTLTFMFTFFGLLELCAHPCMCVQIWQSWQRVVFLNQGTVLISQGILRRQHFYPYKFIQAAFVFTVLRAARLQERVGDGGMSWKLLNPQTSASGNCNSFEFSQSMAHD